MATPTSTVANYKTTVKGTIDKKPSGSTVNKGGTIVKAGNYTSGNITQSIDFDKIDLHTGVHGSKVAGPETDTTIADGTDTKGTYQPLSTGTFAYKMTAGNFVVRRVATTLSGVASSVLYSGASDWGGRKSIHKIEQVRTLKQSTWNWITGQATTNTVEINYAGISGTTDNAARPSRSVPGELVYMETGYTPTQADYSAKTG